MTDALHLRIGDRFDGGVPDLATAQSIYVELRDASGEGASTFPSGHVCGDGKTWRISYNGRVWLGNRLVMQ